MSYLCPTDDAELLFDPTSGRVATADVWEAFSRFDPVYARAMELKPVCCAVACRGALPPVADRGALRCLVLLLLDEALDAAPPHGEAECLVEAQGGRLTIGAEYDAALPPEYAGADPLPLVAVREGAVSRLARLGALVRCVAACGGTWAARYSGEGPQGRVVWRIELPLPRG